MAIEYFDEIGGAMDEELSVLAKSVQHLEAQRMADMQMITILLSTHPNPARLRELWQRLTAATYTAAGLAEIGHGVPPAYRQLIADEAISWSKMLDQLAGIDSEV